MKGVWCFLLLFLCSLPSLAEELNAKISPTNESETIRPGEIKDFTIHIWPAHNLENRQYLIFEGLNLFNKFYIVSIYEQMVNQNNQDVWEVKVMAAVGPPFETTDKLSLKRFGHTLNFSMEPWMDALKLEGQPVQNYQIVTNKFKTPFDWESLYPWIIVLLLLLLLSSPFLMRQVKRMSEKRNLERARKEKIAFWKSRFEGASSRSDFEEIGRGRSEWVELYGETTVPIKAFCDLLDEIQYRPDWSEDDESEITEYFDHIRDLFNDGI